MDTHSRQRHHHVHNQFPPSPPPSPPSVKKRHRKRDSNDPFLQLGDPANHAFANPPLSTPSDAQGSEEPLYKRVCTPIVCISKKKIDNLSSSSTCFSTASTTTPQYTNFLQIIVTPFLFVSFLISLFLVDTQNAITRTKNSTLFNFLDPDPYQDPGDSKWDRRGSTTHVMPPDALNPDQRRGKDKRKRKSWHLHKKIRKIARLEISDAFEMRRRVMVAMAVAIGLVGYVMWCIFAWVLRFW